MVSETSFEPDNGIIPRRMRLELKRVVDFFAQSLNLPKHAGSCSNQNVLDPVGAYIDVEQCGCGASTDALRKRIGVGSAAARVDRAITAANIRKARLHFETCKLGTLCSDYDHRFLQEAFGGAWVPDEHAKTGFTTEEANLLALATGKDGVALTLRAHPDPVGCPPPAVLSPDSLETIEIDIPVREFPTLESLVAAIEDLFDCRNGRHRYCHDTMTPEGTPVQYVYEMLAAYTYNVDQPIQRLRQAVYADFVRLHKSCPDDRKPVLYWRFSAVQRIAEEGYPHERDTAGWLIRTRFAIPSADYSVAKLLVIPRDGRYREI